MTALLLLPSAMADVTGTISGVVEDSSGAILTDARVVATNQETGIKMTVITDSKGFYSFPALPVGTYRVEVSKSGFKTYIQSDLLLRVNDSIRIDAALNVGDVMEHVSVTADAVHVETTSTQLGEVISDQKIEAVPLNGRSYTDLLALQAGVVPQTSGLSGGMGGQFTSTGFGIQPVSGELSAGNLSVNGMREAANGFLLNGAPVQETAFSGTSAIPNLDSIQEFRILTNNVDPEYGNYAGGQINVITKSGTNSWHGSAFEFLRNTALDSRPYFALPTLPNPIFRQNQFGGTFGGPVIHNKVFFFADYQGTRMAEGATNTQQVVVPSVAERNGDFSALTSQLTGTVQGSNWASQLSSALGYSVTAGENYYTAGCASSSQCVFPNAQIPTSAFSTPSKNLLKYIPLPNGVNLSGQPIYGSGKIPTTLGDDKGSGRLDANTALGLISGYYFFDNNTLFTPNLVEPGFGTGSSGRDQVIDLGDSKTISSTSVNEARLSYTRLYEVVNEPFGGIGSGLLAQLGFTNIVPSVPQFAGVPQIGFNTFGIGSGSSPLPIIENTYSALDNFTKIIGTHTMKFGGLVRFIQMTEKNLGSNGSFNFNGSETGIDFADFLIGAPNGYSQGQGFPSAGRTHYLGFYGQDSWRVRPNLTLNYGLRYDISRPWSELHNEIETIIPGEQSQVFPGSPTGWVFPGDPHVPSTLAPTRWDNLAPRIGIAYSPSSHTALDKITGGPGNFSIRAAYGKFYTSFEGATNFNEIGDAPFGGFYGSPAPPEFANPYVTRSNGVDNGQRFPIAPPPYNISPQHPDTSINWANFVSIGSSPAFYYKNATPYAEQYDVAIDRQLPQSMLLSIAYVGSQGHHLLSAIESNPGDPGLCLFLSNPANLAAGQTPCGPFGENNVYTTAAGQTFYGTRPALMGQTNGTPNFSSDSWFKTIGNSDYNSLQVTLRRSRGRLDFLAAYTYSKSMDNASGYGEGVNVVNPNLKALSAFDSTNNFVVSQTYQLPIDAKVRNRLTSGWAISSITHFATGLPVTLLENDDRSLLGTNGGGPIQLAIDTPDHTPGPLNFANPRTAKTYFNTSLFSFEPLGQLGDAPRRFFHGPGINNWDITLSKDTRLTERTSLQFRADFFNAFNHAQFSGPDGTVNDSSFGEIGSVNSTNPARIMQFALKLQF
ncbi:MAG TPA: TonB-dependent receptor [Terriglobales bacterium]|nr:TonB-dependent receptor [Terriglobales bacterium]